MKTFFLFLFISTAAVPVYAGTASLHKDKKERWTEVADTIPQQQQEIPADEKEIARQPLAKGKPIKEVPRAKNQAKPQMVTPAPIKMRPVKIIKPKISGKGLGR